MLRIVLIAAALLAGSPGLAAGCDGAIQSARYEGPTGQYPHGVLGDALEWGQLRIDCSGGAQLAELPEALVFEDVAPRVVDLDGDGAAEVIVVESHRDRGARLAVWGLTSGKLDRLAQTPFIGTRFRWLAPVGAADLDGDGAMEIAYVDRPHLARILRVWRYEDGQLREVASAPGFTNHRIGETEISGGMRDCDGRPEMIVASADWSRVLAVSLSGRQLVERDIGPHEGPESFRDAVSCR
ncbi:VCBS repeat-containing protein [Tropicimonas sp. TH_r6]|uniref:FG-GAP repeat domain-containing protein n=1 Tax=Tropicimonas sp. TH_r6 TaxID=3082085 RepID=UPI002954407A|nr:VCBS repeat-containing protein [Tropicimonas sp. TH_r6]MDV7144547.1 VCBS repeat-containing protein [Tropicimonas sp. TH_r6]